MTRPSRFSAILGATVLLAAAAVLLMVVGMNRGAPGGERAYASDPGAEAEAVQAAGGLTTRTIDLPAVQAHCRSQTGQHYDDCVTANKVVDALAGDCADCSGCRCPVKMSVSVFNDYVSSGLLQGGWVPAP